jgi:hypothetical protein
MTPQDQTSGTEIVTVPPKMMLIEPAAEIEELKKHWEKIQQLKKSILDKSDIQEISGRTYVKRSGWRKMAAAFAISDRTISKEREDLGDGQFLWRIEVEAFHPRSGRSMTGVAVCSSKERKFAHPEHDVFAIAHTRAINRSISDLVGLGEVSAEEIEADQPSPSTVDGEGQGQTANPLVDYCVCKHWRKSHVFEGKEPVCMDCLRAGVKDLKCNLAPVKKV